MSEGTGHAAEEQLRILCQELTALVKSLPGPVRRMVVRTTDHAVEVEWPVIDAVPAPATRAPELAQPPAASFADHGPDSATAQDVDAPPYVIRAPLVGTFYRSSQPDADPFVRVNDIVEAGQTVAIVEAMKLLNHISADVSGRVVGICAGDGESVEFGQPLIQILPLGDDQPA